MLETVSGQCLRAFVATVVVLFCDIATAQHSFFFRSEEARESVAVRVAYSKRQARVN
jgi:hypothetical protein